MQVSMWFRVDLRIYAIESCDSQSHRDSVSILVIHSRTARD
jgi:hypothetical protein